MNIRIVSISFKSILVALHTSRKILANRSSINKDTIHGSLFFLLISLRFSSKIAPKRKKESTSFQFFLAKTITHIVTPNIKYVFGLSKFVGFFFGEALVYVINYVKYGQKHTFFDVSLKYYVLNAHLLTCHSYFYTVY